MLFPLSCPLGLFIDSSYFVSNENAESALAGPGALHAKGAVVPLHAGALRATGALLVAAPRGVT